MRSPVFSRARCTLVVTAFESFFAENKQFRVFSDAVQAGILVLDVETGKGVHANRYFAELFAIDRDNAFEVAEAWSDLFVDDKEREKLLLSFVDSDLVRDFEIQLRTRTGRKIWGQVALAHLSLAHDSLLLFSVVDITPLKTAEGEGYRQHRAQKEALARLSASEKRL